VTASGRVAADGRTLASSLPRVGPWWDARVDPPAEVATDGARCDDGSCRPEDVMALTFELVAHDLCSPLASSRRAVDCLLQQQPAGDPSLLTGLAETLEQVERIVTGLIGTERLERSTAGQPIDLAEVTSQAVAASTDPARVGLLAVTGRTTGDPALLRAAIGNLIENALRHARGEVLVQCGAVEDGNLVLVDDDGPGIPPALRELIFRPLVRLDPDAVGGLGLGLALVRRVAELHDGRVWAEEAPGGGARFGLWLP
jgi:signal transduction histidine kinase